MGLGEQVGNLDRAGTYRVNRNTDDPSYDGNSKTIYSSIPFYIATHNKGTYGIFLDNTSNTTFNFGAANNRFASFSAEDGVLTYYIIGGESVKEVVQNSYNFV